MLVGFSELEAEMWKYTMEMEKGQAELEEYRKKFLNWNMKI